MKIAVFHGSPRKGNTYTATKIFLAECARHQSVEVTEFFFPTALPEFCTGCQMCLGGPRERCPHAAYVTPLYEAMMDSDALLFTTPHLGGCAMSACMKNLLDHLDFFTLMVAPRKEMFRKKAFIITTASGSTAAIRPIRKFLKNWGMNRVEAIGLRLFTDRWSSLSGAKQASFERRLKTAAKRFVSSQIKQPYPSTVFFYHMSKFVLKRYVGENAYPYQYWEEKGFFSKRPF